jgi:hypothetical protein
MGKTFRKYEFKSEAAAIKAINQLGEDHGHVVAKIGILEGSTKYSVDMLWNGPALASWSDKLFWCPPFGVMIIGASDVVAEWVSTCRKLHPEFFPVPPPDEEDPE